jgi:hypothetical protein
MANFTIIHLCVFITTLVGMTGVFVVYQTNDEVKQDGYDTLSVEKEAQFSCKIGIFDIGGEEMTTLITNDWKRRMIEAYKRPDWWNVAEVEIEVGLFFTEALRRSSVYTKNHSEAHVILVTRFGSLLYALQSHPISLSEKPEWLEKYNQEFLKFVESPLYKSQHGYGFIIESGHVGSRHDHLWHQNNLVLVTDPLAEATSKVNVPYVSVWPQNWEYKELDRIYWLGFMGGFSGGPSGQRARLFKEYLSLKDERVFWNHPNISNNAADRWDWMSRTKYCLDAQGDVQSTLREYETLITGCVPVMATSYSYPFHEILGSYTQWSIIVPPHFSLHQIILHLESISEEVYLAKKNKALEVAHNFMYRPKELFPAPFLPALAPDNIITEICKNVPSILEKVERAKVEERYACQNARKLYLLKNEDVAKENADPWIHYKVYGKKENRTWEGKECQY